MKILFYGARDYDQRFFDKLKPEHPDIDITFIEANLYAETASLAAGYDGICAFVNAWNRSDRRARTSGYPSDPDALCRL